MTKIYFSNSVKSYKKGHKSNKCPQPKKKFPDEKNKKKLIIKSSLIYTMPNGKNKSKSTTYVIKKKSNGKVVAVDAQQRPILGVNLIRKSWGFAFLTRIIYQINL